MSSEKGEKNVDAKANGEKSILCWKNLEIFFNTINHGLIAITTFYLTWYCIKSGITTHVSLHAIFSTIGYQLLMAEGILVLYKQNSYTQLVNSRGTKTTIHWILLASGSIFAIAGVLIEFIWRQSTGRSHGWHHRHAVWGLVSVIMLLPTIIAGLCALFPVSLKKLIKPLLSKSSHIFFAVFAFVTGMVSVVMGYTDLRWSKTNDPGDMRYAMAWILSIITGITLLGPTRTAVNYVKIALKGK